MANILTDGKGWLEREITGFWSDCLTTSQGFFAADFALDFNDDD